MIGPSYCLSEVCESFYFPLNTKIRHEHTKHQYRIAIRNLCEIVGHDPLVGDLSDDNVARMMRMLLDRGLAERTVNGRRERIHAIWTWLCRRGHLQVWPLTMPLDEPQRIPRAWSRDELRKLFNAASLERGCRKGVPKWLYWQCLLSMCWDSGERVGAVLKCRWEHIDLDTRWLIIPCELRKGRKKDAAYQLSPETCELLRMMRRRSPELILPKIFHHMYLWQAYSRILKSAGLPTDRGSKFHRIRRSTASHFAAAGGNPQKLMGHASAETTESYLDPTIVKPPQATDLLFRPDRPDQPPPRAA